MYLFDIQHIIHKNNISFLYLVFAYAYIVGVEHATTARYTFPRKLTESKSKLVSINTLIPLLFLFYEDTPSDSH